MSKNCNDCKHKPNYSDTNKCQHPYNIYGFSCVFAREEESYFCGIDAKYYEQREGSVACEQ